MAIDWRRAYADEREIAKSMCRTKKLMNTLDGIDRANLSFKQKFLQILQYENKIDQAFYEWFEQECLDEIEKRFADFTPEEKDRLLSLDQKLTALFKANTPEELLHGAH